MKIIFLSFCSLLVGGLSAQAQWQKLPVPSVASVTSLVQEGNILYAATNGGIHSSPDTGRTWQYVEGSSGAGFTSRYMYSGLVDMRIGANGDIFALARMRNIEDPNYWHLRRSEDGGHTWATVRSDYRPTTEYLGDPAFALHGDTVVSVDRDGRDHLEFSADGGHTWHHAVATVNPTAHLYSAHGTLYSLGWGNPLRRADQGITRPWTSVYWSPTAAGNPVQAAFPGNSIALLLEEGTDLVWLEGGAGPGVKRGLPSPSDPLTVELLPLFVAEGDRIWYRPGKDGPLYVTDDGGASWSARAATGLLGTAADRFVFVGGTILVSNVHGLFRSFDGGETFSPAQLAAPDVTSFGRSGQHLFLGTLQGFFVSHDSGQTWAKHSGNAAQFNTLPVEIAVDSPRVIVQTQDLVLTSADNGLTWAAKPVTIYSTHGDNVAAAGGSLYYSGAGGIFRSDDGGASWTNLIGWVVGHLDAIGDTVLMGAGNIRLSPDKGATWQNMDIAPAPYTNKMVKLVDDTLYSFADGNLLRRPLQGTWETIWEPGFPHFEYDSLSQHSFSLFKEGGKLYLGVYGKGLFASVDGGFTWTLQTGAGEPGHFYVHHLDKGGHVVGAFGGLYAKPLGPALPDEVSGRVFWDSNQNGIFDVGETNLAGIIGVANNGSFASTDTGGVYRFPFPSVKNASISAVKPLDYSTVSPPSFMVTQASGGHDFAVRLDANVTDLGLAAQNSAHVKPGSQTTVVLVCSNRGTVPKEGFLEFTPDLNLQWLGAVPPPTSTVGNKRAWDLSAIPVFGSANVEVRLSVPTNVAVGTVLNSVAEVKTAGADANGADNQALLQMPVVASFDPNDKAVSPVGNITPSMVADGQTLSYTVRFQNTGTAPADVVRLLDTLDLNLDISSLRVLGASHTVRWALAGAGVLEFLFEGIDLPPATLDEPGSHGFVHFALDAKTSLVVGDSAQNRAFIYFDFNDPIETNTVISRVDEGSGIDNPSSLRAGIYPSVVDNLFTVRSLENGAMRCTVMDERGKTVWQGTLQGGAEERILAKGWPAGPYFVVFATGEKTAVLKMVKI